MSRTRRRLSSSMFLLLLAMPLSAAESVRLEVRLEQHGHEVLVEDGRAVIDRAPFDLILTAPAGETVLVRVASTPSLVDRARSGASLENVFKPGQSLPEAPLNEDEEILIDDPNTQHAWWYEGVGDHRCTKATEIDGGYECRRRVTRLVFQNPFVPPSVPLRTQAAINRHLANRPKPWATPVEFASVDQLNFVFLIGEPDMKARSTKEKQRAVLQLEFSEPPRRAFELEIRQKGLPVPIADHVVDLVREPFDVLMRINQGTGVLVHASLDPPVFNLASSGRWLGKTFKKYGTYALDLGNKSETLRLSPGETNHGGWVRYDETRSSFKTLEEVDGSLRGHLTISNVAMEKTSLPITELGPSKIYLVLYSGRVSSDEDGGVEFQREWLELRFPKR